jgi:hypothetical protein
MQNRTDAIVAKLEHDWPDWKFWLIYPAVGGITWCARRWDESGPAINASSADALAEGDQAGRGEVDAERPPPGDHGL